MIFVRKDEVFLFVFEGNTIGVDGFIVWDARSWYHSTVALLVYCDDSSIGYEVDTVWNVAV